MSWWACWELLYGKLGQSSAIENGSAKAASRNPIFQHQAFHILKVLLIVSH